MKIRGSLRSRGGHALASMTLAVALLAVSAHYASARDPVPTPTDFGASIDLCNYSGKPLETSYNTIEKDGNGNASKSVRKSVVIADGICFRSGTTTTNITAKWASGDRLFKAEPPPEKSDYKYVYFRINCHGMSSVGEMGEPQRCFEPTKK